MASPQGGPTAYRRRRPVGKTSPGNFPGDRWTPRGDSGTLSVRGRGRRGQSSGRRRARAMTTNRIKEGVCDCGGENPETLYVTIIAAGETDCGCPACAFARLLTQSMPQLDTLSADQLNELSGRVRRAADAITGAVEDFRD